MQGHSTDREGRVSNPDGIESNVRGCAEARAAHAAAAFRQSVPRIRDASGPVGRMRPQNGKVPARELRRETRCLSPEFSEPAAGGGLNRNNHGDAPETPADIFERAWV